MFKGKKGFALTGSAAIFIIIIAVFLFSAGGVLKFLFTDKTPLIIGGFILFIILLSKRRRGN